LHLSGNDIARRKSVILPRMGRTFLRTAGVGHGPLSDRAGLLKWLADFETMRNQIDGMVRQGRIAGMKQ
jgi:hypothetical protein